MPVSVWLSMWSMSPTIVLTKRSKLLTIRFSISSGGSPP
jgi:hypothetical protein